MEFSVKEIKVKKMKFKKREEDIDSNESEDEKH